MSSRTGPDPDPGKEGGPKKHVTEQDEEAEKPKHVTEQNEGPEAVKKTAMKKTKWDAGVYRTKKDDPRPALEIVEDRTKKAVELGNIDERKRTEIIENEKARQKRKASKGDKKETWDRLK